LLIRNDISMMEAVKSSLRKRFLMKDRRSGIHFWHKDL
jgi:hypothetical protein